EAPTLCYASDTGPDLAFLHRRCRGVFPGKSNGVGGAARRVDLPPEPRCAQHRRAVGEPGPAWSPRDVFRSGLVGKTPPACRTRDRKRGTRGGIARVLA